MLVRVLQAYSGNNSGSYVLVGTFEKSSDAEALRAELEEMFVAQSEWFEAQASKRAAESPMHAFATRAGVATRADVGGDDDWPAYGALPTASVIGAQLVVFVDYTVTFPSFIGEVIYRRGGRVSVELDHAHESIVLVHTLWVDGGWRDRDDQRQVSAFRAAVEDGALASLYEHPAATPPILAAGFWSGVVELVHAPPDVAAAVRLVDALASEHGLSSRLALFETPLPRRDLVGALRRFELDQGEHQLILWKAGEDLTATVRAVRSVTGLGVAEATELVASAPIEVVRGVSEREATTARDALEAVGAEVELLGPQHLAG